MTKSRTHWIILYPDDPTHKLALDKLDSGLFRYSAILHDHDIESDSNGEVKKAHWNVLVKFSSPRSADSVAKELGIKPNYIKYVGNTKSAERYHLHLDCPEKSTYSITEVFGTDVESVGKSCAESLSESQEVLVIIEMLESYHRVVSIKDFLIDVCSHELYGTFRRMGGLATSLVAEHNQSYSRKENKDAV